MFDTDLSDLLRSRPGLLPFAGAVVAWTLVWTVYGIEDVLTQTALFTGRAGGSVDAHEVMELVFVASYTGIRWAVGMAILLVGGGVVAWGLGREAAERE